MKVRGAAIQGGLALLALGAAYLTWRREPEPHDGDVVALDLTRSALEKVRYEDGRKWVELTKGTLGSEEVVWVREGQKPQPPPPPAPDAGMAATDGGTAEAPRLKIREFRGNEMALKLYEKFAPLYAARALGALDEKKLEDVGLKNAERRVEVTARRVKHAFVAGPTAFGAGPP